MAGQETDPRDPGNTTVVRPAADLCAPSTPHRRVADSHHVPQVAQYPEVANGNVLEGSSPRLVNLTVGGDRVPVIRFRRTEYTPSDSVRPSSSAFGTPTGAIHIVSPHLSKLLHGRRATRSCEISHAVVHHPWKTPVLSSGWNRIRCRITAHLHT